MKRITQAVFAAILINALVASAFDHLFHVAGVYPPYGQPYFDVELWLLALSYRFVITVGAAYVTALIAREMASKALWISGGFGTLMWIFGTIAMKDLGPLWYGVVGAVTTLPLVFLGGALYRKRNAAVNQGV